MSLRHVSRLGILLAIGCIGTTIVISALSSQTTRKSPRADTSAMRLPDTLPPWGRALSDTRMEVERDHAAIDPLVEQVKAAIDALNGRAGIPARLILNAYRRERLAVVLDLTADNLPQMVFLGVGGTVRILPDGRRIILARHN